MKVKSYRRCELWRAAFEALAAAPATGQELAQRMGVDKRSGWSCAVQLYKLGYLKIVGYKRHYRRLARVYAIKTPYVPMRTARQKAMVRQSLVPRPYYHGLANWGAA